MASAFWSAAALPLGAGLVLLYVCEVLLVPRPRAPWRREWGANAIHAGLWLFACALGFLLWRRPWFAAFNGVALVLLLVFVSRAKERVLREPFLVHDFDYFVDVLRHPRFYLPFLGVAGVIAAALAYAGVVWAGLTLEPSLLRRIAPGELVAGVGVMAVAGIVLLIAGSRGAAQPEWDPKRDLERLGFLAFLWLYGRALLKGGDFVAPPGPFTAPPQPGAGPRPAIVAVQSESFFDVRELFDGIRPEILREIDALRAESVAHGKLTVPAWGANTIRTEFAFLTGIGEAALGVHRFNPYGRAARPGVPTIATYLKALGYRTVCVHPFPAAFYRRDLVLPALGFDEFVDVSAFGVGDKSGPFTGDEAVARKVAAILEAATQPVFVYVITMENHGPLHLESVAPGDVERFYAQPPPEGCDELTVYLRHLANADRMAGTLREALSRRREGGVLAWYGDHVPMMPGAYPCVGWPDGRTDYFVWSSKSPSRSMRGLRVDHLASEMLSAAFPSLPHEN